MANQVSFKVLFISFSKTCNSVALSCVHCKLLVYTVNLCFGQLCDITQCSTDDRLYWPFLRCDHCWEFKIRASLAIGRRKSGCSVE